jgi:hypothetical protein
MLFHALKKFGKLENSARFMMHHLMLIFLFTTLYYISEQFLYYEKEEKLVKDPMNLLECFHFSLVTQTTVGYGHSYPTNLYSRIINIMQLLTIYGVLVLEI